MVSCGVNREFEEAVEGRGKEERVEENKKKYKNGGCSDIQVVESNETEMKDMMRQLIEMSQNMALKQEVATSRWVEEVANFRNESNVRMERMEGDMEYLRQRMEELEAGGGMWRKGGSRRREW